jgi:hypothetical protein
MSLIKFSKNAESRECPDYLTVPKRIINNGRKEKG